jgi:uncharacterized repeat protein (TIGR02543 family)
MTKKITSWTKNTGRFFGILILLLLYGVALQAQTPVAANGRLSVSGTNLVNENGDPVQLRGMSSHGPQWFSYCYNYDAMEAMVNDWGVDIFRLAMYVEEDGYVLDPEFWKSWIDDMVNLTGQFGVYSLIDWHVHDPGDPWADIDEARDFWDHMSRTHAGKEHVLYEICNEPNGVDWARVKSYAEDIIPIIRANDPNAVIIVGTPNWSQDVDIASQNPLTYSNIMYALHFYSGTHGQSLRQKAETAMNNGAAIFVTEWGTSQANGDGGPYLTESDTWLSWMQTNNLSWCNWSYADKEEVSAALVFGSCLGGTWNNTSPSGTYVKNKILVPADSWAGNGNIPPTGTITSPTTGAIYELGDVVTINATATDADGSVSLVEFFAGNTKLGQDATAPYSYAWTTSALGDFALTLRVTDNSGATNTSLPVQVSVVDQIIQYAYPDGASHAVPGAIQATFYDVGGEGVAYHDADATNKGPGIRNDEGVDTETSQGGNIGYVVNGEWVEYTIDVANSGTYDIALLYASQPGGGRFHIDFDGVNATGPVNVPQTGDWAAYQTLTLSDIVLTAGEQVMRMTADIGDFNFAKFTFTYTGVPPDNSPPNAIASATPTNGLVPLAVSFNGSNSNDPDGDVLTYAWNFGDGSTSSQVSPSHTYTSTGSYIAVLTVSDGEFNDQASVTINVTEQGGNNAPIAAISANPLQGQAPLAVSFSAAASSDPDNDPLTYSWNFGDGSTGTGVSPAHTYTTEGNYVATVTVSDGDLSDQASATIAVSEVTNNDCDNPVTISLPFTKNGAATSCYVTSGDIYYINSWNMDVVEVNGVDFTNVWGNNMPARIDGNYYIYYQASVGWAHLEIDGQDDSDPPVTYTLTTSVTGQGSVSPANGTFDEGSNVTLTATAAAGWEFSGWSGDAAGSSASTTITMNTNKSVTATFSETQVISYPLTVNVVGQGSVTPNGGNFVAGTSVTLTATASSGYVFAGWSGAATGTSPSVSILMDAAKSVTATFSEVQTETFTLSTSTTGAQGSISLSPAGGVYDAGTVVTVTAVAGSSSEFNSWSGAITGSVNPQTIVMNSNKSVNADFIVIETQLCENPTAITLPFVQNGAGEFCWVTTQVPAYVNSWNLALLEINGADFTNTWANNFPAPIDGKYYIHYVGNFGWSHFEIPQAKNAVSLTASANDISVFPNPFSSEFTIDLGSVGGVSKIEVMNSLGQVVELIDLQEEDTRAVKVQIDSPGNLFIIRVFTGNSILVKTAVRN